MTGKCKGACCRRLWAVTRRHQNQLPLPASVAMKKLSSNCVVQMNVSSGSMGVYVAPPKVARPFPRNRGRDFQRSYLW